VFAVDRVDDKTILGQYGGEVVDNTTQYGNAFVRVDFHKYVSGATDPTNICAHINHAKGIQANARLVLMEKKFGKSPSCMVLVVIATTDIAAGAVPKTP
jgi:hypothetical protein